MFAISLVTWWYGRGWMLQFRRLEDLMAKVSDYFSFGMLLATMFAPFRQLTTSTPLHAPVGYQIRILFDNLLSRLIGAMVRTFVLVVGLVVALCLLIGGVIWVFAWLLVPTLPIVVAIWELVYAV